MRVLFVDDEPMMLRSMQMWLRRGRPGWRCAYASSGAKALEELRRSNYDAIVADLRMPGMDGAELLARVRIEHPSIVRVILSGQAERAAMSRALVVAHEFLSKPFPLPELVACLERLVTSERSDRSAPR